MMPSKKSSKKKSSSKETNATTFDEDRANEILATAYENDPERAQQLLDLAKKTAEDAGLPVDQVLKMIQQSVLEREKEEERSKLTEHQRRKLEKKDRKAESSFQDSKTICDACGQTKAKLNYCSKCKCRLYCNETCQLGHWKSSHKRECKHLRTLRDVPQIPREYSQQNDWHWVVGTIRTQHHGNYFVVMDQTSTRAEQYVPLAYVKLDNEQQEPTPTNVAECLYNAMWFPEFDTTVGGWRRPYYVRVIEGSNGDDDLCVLLTRLQMVIRVPVKHDFMKQWFCLQMGWSDEGEPASSFSRIEPNGMARKDLKEQLHNWNELALKEQKPRQEFPTRDEILRLPVESDETPRLSLANSIEVAMHEGFLYIFRRDIFYRERLVVDAKSSCRPDVDDVVARLCHVIMKLGERPAAVSLGNPSMCSHTDVHLYEQALDESIVRDHCSLSLFGNAESNLVDYYLPLWRQTNRI